MNFEFQLSIRGQGRQISDDSWRSIDKQVIDCWKEVSKNLSAIDRDYMGVTFRFTFNWSSVVQRLEQTYDIYSRLIGPDGVAIHSVMEEFGALDEWTVVPVVVSSHQLRSSEKGLASHALAYALNDIFISINLALPSTCDFYSARLHEIEPSKGLVERGFEHLCNHKFDCAMMQAVDGKFPHFDTIPIADCVDWVKSAGDTTTKRATSPQKKLLYALLHFGNPASAESDIVWIFYILETAFDTKPGENFGALHRRICKLLQLVESDANDFKKKLRALYDLRSSLIHGGHEILHPDYMNLINSEDGQKGGKVRETLEFGRTLCIATIRQLARHGFKRLEFNEEIIGVTLNDGYVYE